MKAKIATIAVIGFLTLTVIALGVSALGEAQDASAATSKAAVESSNLGDGDNTVVTAFKFV